MLTTDIYALEAERIRVRFFISRLDLGAHALADATRAVYKDMSVSGLSKLLRVSVYWYIQLIGAPWVIKNNRDAKGFMVRLFLTKKG